MSGKVYARLLKLFFGVLLTMIVGTIKHSFRIIKSPQSKRDKLILCSTILLTIWLALRILSLIACDHSFVLLSSEHNYLKGLKDPSFTAGNFLVNNDKCRIPDIKFWSEEVRSIVKREEIKNCSDLIRLPNIKDLISVNGQTLILDEDALKQLELSLEDIECCYQVVERVEQDDRLRHYDTKADYAYRYSDACYPMGQETNPHAGFLRITCYQKRYLGLFKKKMHVDFHLVAMFPPVDSKTEVGKKLAFWKERASRPTDHNSTSVLIIGIDSTSRINFHRMMPSTIKTLTEKLGAVEMNGFTKIAKNTFPNLVPMLSSYSFEELVELCFQSFETPLDGCPFLWKHFSAMNYFTAFVDDSPAGAVFNFGKFGFLRQPMDLYFRPWMRAVYDNNEAGCIGRRRPEQVEISYVRDLVKLASSEGIPYFNLVWFSDRSHDSMGEVEHMDEPISEALLHMKSTGSLENTVVIVMSDHGYRHLDIRRTLSGWFEDKLPGLWISLPENLLKSHPSWKAALHHNSRQLVTPYNIYYTLRDIIRHNSHQLGISTFEESTSADVRGGSLLEKLPERSCDEAGVPWEFCACTSPIEYKGTNKFVLMASHHFIEQLNKGLDDYEYRPCRRINGYNVIAMATVPKLVPSNQISSLDDYSRNTSIQEADLFKGKSLLVVGYGMGEEPFYVETILKYNQTTLQFDDLYNSQTSRIQWCYFWTVLKWKFCRSNFDANRKISLN